MNRFSTIRSWTIISVIALSLGCNVKSEKKYKYNSCIIFQPYNTPDSSFNFAVNISDLKYNELSPSNSHGFYGAFIGVEKYRKIPVNILIFETSILKEDLDGMISRYQLSVQAYQNAPCFDFYSSFDVTKYVDKRYPVVMGRFEQEVKD